MTSPPTIEDASNAAAKVRRDPARAMILSHLSSNSRVPLPPPRHPSVRGPRELLGDGARSMSDGARPSGGSQLLAWSSEQVAPEQESQGPRSPGWDASVATSSSHAPKRISKEPDNHDERSSPTNRDLVTAQSRHHHRHSVGATYSQPFKPIWEGQVERADVNDWTHDRWEVEQARQQRHSRVSEEAGPSDASRVVTVLRERGQKFVPRGAGRGRGRHKPYPTDSTIKKQETTTGLKRASSKAQLRTDLDTAEKSSPEPVAAATPPAGDIWSSWEVAKSSQGPLTNAPGVPKVSTKDLSQDDQDSDGRQSPRASAKGAMSRTSQTQDRSTEHLDEASGESDHTSVTGRSPDIETVTCLVAVESSNASDTLHRSFDGRISDSPSTVPVDIAGSASDTAHSLQADHEKPSNGIGFTAPLQPSGDADLTRHDDLGCTPLRTSDIAEIATAGVIREERKASERDAAVDRRARSRSRPRLNLDGIGGRSFLDIHRFGWKRPQEAGASIASDSQSPVASAVNVEAEAAPNFAFAEDPPKAHQAEKTASSRSPSPEPSSPVPIIEEDKKGARVSPTPAQNASSVDPPTSHSLRRIISLTPQEIPPCIISLDDEDEDADATESADEPFSTSIKPFDPNDTILVADHNALPFHLSPSQAAELTASALMQRSPSDRLEQISNPSDDERFHAQNHRSGYDARPSRLPWEKPPPTSARSMSHEADVNQLRQEYSNFRMQAERRENELTDQLRYVQANQNDLLRQYSAAKGQLVEAGNKIHWLESQLVDTAGSLHALQQMDASRNVRMANLEQALEKSRRDANQGSKRLQDLTQKLADRDEAIKRLQNEVSAIYARVTLS